MAEILGVDVGGVILDWVRTAGTDVDFSGDNYLNTPTIEDSFEALATLNAGRFRDSVYLVSRYPVEKGPTRVREWLKHQDFYGKTSILEGNLLQLTERQEKTPICQRLGITHFVDDRVEVLRHMVGIVPNLYLFQGLDEDKKAADAFPQIQFFEGWASLLTELRG